MLFCTTLRLHYLLACALLVLAAVFPARAAFAQDMPADHQHVMPSPAGWTWTTDANAFFGYNHQQRQFLDTTAWESQNWFMASGERNLGRGRLSVTAMASLEPFTMAARGSPQLFQTGEVFKRAPIMNYQHPHDLVMGLGVTYRAPLGRATYVVGADLVGSPTLGPTPFMHRESGRENPQVPLLHHYLDSSHSTPGVLRAGVTAGPFTFESSVFRGAEPDENRLNIERPRLDSWAVRAQFNRGPWHAQVSGGHLTRPEAWSPFDHSKITASVSYEGAVKNRALNATVAWGGIREFNGFNGDADGVLFEGNLRATPVSTVYGRLEVAQKEVIGLHVHTLQDVHPHFYYLIDVGTVGYLRDLPWTSSFGRVGVGADVTWYKMPRELSQFYATSHSYHVFLRWRPVRDAGMAHHH